ncbi:hypothetical protein QL285_006543 [Trifolium repens]|nr:hypothetical protein QL285_006543 [Trifolium repens]
MENEGYLRVTDYSTFVGIKDYGFSIVLRKVKYFVEERCRRRLLVEWQRPPFAEVYLMVGLASKGLGYKEKAISLFKLEFHSKQLVL